MPQLAPRRRLPWDILALVFKEADSSTLAALGGVSYDFLVSTSPILYQSIEVSTKDQLEALFCERKEVKKTSTPSRINPLLSLSQIQNLSVDFTAMQFWSPVPLRLHSSRHADADIPLNSVRVKCRHSIIKRVLDSLYISLLPHLNPIRFVVTAALDMNFGNLVDLASYRLYDWTRIEVLELNGCLPFSHRCNGRDDNLGALPALTLDRRRVLRLRVETFLHSHWRHPSSFLRVFMDLERAFGLGLMQEGSIILIVCSEEERKETEKGLREVMKEEWKGLFVIELQN